LFIYRFLIGKGLSDIKDNNTEQIISKTDKRAMMALNRSLEAIE